MSKRTKAKQIVLGLPLDGTFGTTNVPGVDSTDNPTEAIDKVIKIIDLLAPPQSSNLSALSLSISGSYSGRECSLSASPGVNYPTIIDDNTPTANVGGEFADGDQGTLDAKVNSVIEGTVTLSNIDDTGIYGALNVLSDSDPYPGPPEAGFWKSLTANMTTLGSLPADNTEQNYEIEHSSTGATSLDFKIDDSPLTPSVVPNATNPLVVNSGFNTIYVSGVPSISTGDTLNVTYTINDGVSRFYHSTRISTISGSTINNLNVANPVTIPTASGVMAVTEDVSVLNNVFDLDLDLSLRAYNVKNASSPIVNIIRSSGANSEKIHVDTLSNENIRVRSGQGNFPSFGLGASDFGQAYNQTISQMVIGTSDVVEELQMLGGVIQYPNGDYTSNSPVIGPDYTSITGEKWATFKVGTITNQSSFTFTFSGPSGINEEAIGSTVTLNMKCYLIVEGATGWLNANEKYISGNPSADGDACYDVGGSPNNGITRKCTFGTQILTGDVFVRVGLPTNSTKTFRDVI